MKDKEHLEKLIALKKEELNLYCDVRTAKLISPIRRKVAEIYIKHVNRIITDLEKLKKSIN
jgi:hypothetical protein